MRIFSSRRRFLNRGVSSISDQYVCRTGRRLYPPRSFDCSSPDAKATKTDTDQPTRAFLDNHTESIEELTFFSVNLNDRFVEDDLRYVPRRTSSIVREAIESLPSRRWPSTMLINRKAINQRQRDQ